MTPANYGSVFSCCLFGSLMMLYLYVFCRSKRFILRNGTFVIYLAVGVVMIRMLLPWNFHFAMNVESHKILPFLFDLLRVKILSVEFLTILVIIFCFGSCLRLTLFFLTENTVIRICVLFLCMNSIIIYTMTYGRVFSGNSLYVSTGGILFLI